MRLRTVFLVCADTCVYVESIHAPACVCCFCIHVSRLPKPFKPSVSTDLSSVLTQRALLLSALFSELSQGVKEEHITAEDGSSLSGLAQEEENVVMLALCNDVVDT